jgi:acetylornithine/succinyldiaminopimelate/putrescine aminotransferase
LYSEHRLIARLEQALAEQYPGVIQGVRGLGLMKGIVLHDSAAIPGMADDAYPLALLFRSLCVELIGIQNTERTLDIILP